MPLEANEEAFEAVIPVDVEPTAEELITARKKLHGYVRSVLWLEEIRKDGVRIESAGEFMDRAEYVESDVYVSLLERGGDPELLARASRDLDMTPEMIQQFL
jgi:hypothetical protein